MKVLLIEDSRFLRAAIERSLLKAGHEVTSIADGREASLAARSRLPDVILLDMMLPGLVGTSVLSELKQDASTSHIPVIVLTALSRQNERKLKQAGAAAFIEKSALGLEKTADSLLLAIMGALDPPSDAPDPSRSYLPKADAEKPNAEARDNSAEGTT
jgi:CheY-like chemotaxis protein